MAITAQAVKELRDKTGAGMMDCKKALQEHDGDMDKAVDWLRQKGLAKAAKRADRATSEGLVSFKLSEDGKRGVAVEVKCETDFVARGDQFKDFVAQVQEQAFNQFNADHDAFMSANNGNVQELLNNNIATIGENMQVGRLAEVVCSGDGMVGSYLHSNGKLAVLVDIKAAQVNDAVRAVAKNIAMQIAAANPIAVDEKGVPAEAIEREREVYRQKAREEGKPEQIIDKIAEGAVKKFLKEVCLLDQAYIRDDKQTIRDVLKAASKEAGTEISVGRFVRLQLGVE